MHNEKKIDIELIDELIGMCEEKMSEPFRKQKKEEEVIEEEKPSDDIGDDDSQELIDLYSRED